MPRSLYDSFPPEDTPEPARPPGLCSYKSKRGHACSRKAVEGALLCVLHGAPVKLAQDAVQRRLVALQEKSLEVAEDLLLLGDDKARAAMVVAIWDRTGLGPKSTLVVEQTEDLTSLTEEQLAARADRAAAALRALTAPLTPTPLAPPSETIQ